MKKLNRILALALVLLMLVGLFTGCSDGSAPDSAPGSSASSQSSSKPSDSKSESSDSGSEVTYEWDFEEDTSPFEFTFWWPEPPIWGKTAIEAGWDTSIDIYDYITKRTGATMIIDMPSGTQDELAGPMIASGNYPDCMCFVGYNNTYINQMIDSFCRTD